MHSANPVQFWNSRPKRSILRLPLVCFIALVSMSTLSAHSQSVFLDFNTPGQYTNNFNPWNDNGGGNGGVYAFGENTSAGVGGSAGVSVLNNSDTTATYKSGSWNFAVNGATVIVSTLLHTDGQTSG